MTISSRIFDNLPVYARLADEVGLLQHFAEAAQPDVDEMIRLLDQQSYLFDPAITPARFLDYLGQYVGLASIGTVWQGLGMNPKWSDAYKRKVIARVWDYFQKKGTLQGVRDAIDIWLQFPDAQTDKLIIRLPFGKNPTAHPPNWWTYDTPYGFHLNQTYLERQHFGSGDYTGISYRPNWFTIQADDDYWLYGRTQWNQHTVMQVQAPLIDDRSSHLGPERPWIHLSLNAANWNNIFPDIYLLNPEIWNAHADVTTFGWLNLPLLRALRIEKTKTVPTVETIRELTIDGAQYGSGVYGGDWFPYAARPGVVEHQIQAQTKEFGNYPGWQYESSYFGSQGGKIVSTQDRSHTVTSVIEGIYPGVQWGDWYSSVHRPEIETSVGLEPNTGDDWEWNELFDSASLWQFQGGVEISRRLGDVELTGSSPYFSDSHYAKKVVIDPGIPERTRPIYTDQWWANFRSYTETTEVDVMGSGVPCLPGVETRVVDGYDSVLVGGAPGVPASQLIHFVPGTDTFEIVRLAYSGFVGFQWKDEWMSLAVPKYDLTIAYATPEISTLEIISMAMPFSWRELLLAPTPQIHTEPIEIRTFEMSERLLELRLSFGIDVPTIESLETPIETLTWTEKISGVIGSADLSPVASVSPPSLLLGMAVFWGEGNRIDVPVIDWGQSSQNLVRKANGQPLDLDDFWQSHPYEALKKVRHTPSGWALDSPLNVALFNWDLFDDGVQWYTGGSPTIAPTLKNVPRYTVVHLCNTFANWSTRTILKWNEYEIQIPVAQLPLFELYPVLAQVSIAKNWRLLLETREEVYVLSPVTMFWSDILGSGDIRVRSQSVDLDKGLTNLYIEFIVQPKIASKLRSASLVLEDKLLRSVSFLDRLDFSDSGCFGFRFTVPLRFPSGAGSTDENLAIQEFFPSLVQEITKLDLDYAGIPIHRQSQPPEFIPPQTNPGDITEEALRDLLNRVIRHVDALDVDVRALDDAGDKNYVHYQVEPSSRWVISHFLNKEPSVTVILDDDQAVIADLDYSVVNIVVVIFDRSVSGRATCN